MRKAYAARHDALVRSLRKRAPSVEVRGLAAGLHVVAHLPSHIDEERVVNQARDRSIGLYGMSRFRFDKQTVPPQLVVGFANLTESAIERGVEAIGDLLEG
jgi:GntR family transcriptional regulator/MocR family aminotransferase